MGAVRRDVARQVVVSAGWLQCRPCTLLRDQNININKQAQTTNINKQAQTTKIKKQAQTTKIKPREGPATTAAKPFFAEATWHHGTRCNMPRIFDASSLPR